MKDLLKLVEDSVVGRSNALRFDCSPMFDFVIKSNEFRKFEKVRFLRIIFGWSLYTCKTIIDRMIDDDLSFMDITNELNSKGGLS